VKIMPGDQNRIIKYRLEIRARELFFENKTEQQIADILSRESGYLINRSSVYRYIKKSRFIKQGLIERQETQKIRTKELVLDTVQARHEIINELRALAMQAKNEKDIKTALMGLDRAVSALDSLDKRMGNFMPDTQVNVGVGISQSARQEQQFNDFMRVVMDVVDAPTKAKIVSKLDGAMNVIDVPAVCAHTEERVGR